MEDDSNNDLKTLLENAEKFHEEFEYERAFSCYSKALTLSQDENIFVSFGMLCIEAQKFKEAKDLLEQAIQMFPYSPNYQKYFSLAEIYEDNLSLELYLKGVNVISNELSLQKQKSIPQNEKIQEMMFDLGEALAAIAELYQTDLSYLPNSPELCLSYIQKCLEIDPNSFQGTYQYANYCLNKGLTNQGIKNVEKLYELILKDKDCTLTFEERMNVVHLLIELENYKNADEILKILDEDNSNDAEMKYLQAFCESKLDHLKTSASYLQQFWHLKSSDSELISAAKELGTYLEQKLGPINWESEEIFEGSEESGDTDWMEIEDEEIN